MKKIAVIFLLVIYSTTTVGVAVIHIHTCMNKIQGWGFFEETGKKCGNCGMERKDKKNDCCKEEYKVVKKQKEHEQAEMRCHFNPMVATVIVPSYINSPFTAFSPLHQYPKNNAPPATFDVPIYILHCTFRI